MRIYLILLSISVLILIYGVKHPEKTFEEKYPNIAAIGITGKTEMNKALRMIDKKLGEFL